MVKYIPPHQRNKPADEGESGSAPQESRPSESRSDGPSRGGYGGGKGESRNGGYGSDDRPKGDGKGGGKGPARDSRQALGGEPGGDWFKRQEGRRIGREDATEVEVFGEVKARSTAGIDFDKYDNIPVQVTGNGAAEYKPIVRFSEAKLTDSLFDNLRRCGYDRPTPVQKYSIPIVTQGRDCMACAQTGSGKTCAFMVPCLESLLRSGPPRNSKGGRSAAPCGLVLAPTRELAVQIHAESRKFSYDTGIRACIIYGGCDMREQRMDLEKGCDILIATPGRLTDMYERRNVTLHLIQFFILDEADRMLDMGFEPQVRQLVQQTDMTSNRQSMMFSATFPKEVQLMAQDFMQDYIFITVGRVGSASELVTQKVWYADDARGFENKVRKLEEVLKEHRPPDGLAVVFVETKRGADDLERKLYESQAVCAIHGDRSQIEREEALAAFRSGANPVLVATDVAARGLDIPNVSLVVNFDMPKQMDDYVHRIGRTGRAGRKGVAFAFINDRVQYLPEMLGLLQDAKQETPEWFQDLARHTGRRAPKGRGRGPNFGGQDLRELDKDAPPSSSLLSRPAPTFSTPAGGGTGWGASGQEDAW
eukprot:gb/GFBE01024340.1/.p1 GENE.gb/GFBE01024340.1/~~gb/GFBE01024340.1/.p1  ORF type:complete len:592 (+),score=106.43 gb/GFBE01024340.1/:1-1776(+)